MAADPVNHLVGRFAVSASRQAAAGFARTLLAGDAMPGAPYAIPTTFPIAWLGQEDIRTALRKALAALPGAESLAPVHLSQSIAYDRPLVPDHPYWLDLRLSDPDDRNVVRIEANILDAHQDRQARLSATLALVPIAPQP